VDDDAFWAVVEQARRDAGDDAPESVAEAITAVLVERGTAETVAFDSAFHRVSGQGYSFALWGAAYLLNGGCGDDGFDYFRAWLVTRGRAVFEAAVADPDSLAAVVDGDDLDGLECEDALGAAWDAHQQLTGRDLPTTPGGLALPDLGEDWDFDDDAEMRRRYPRLSALVDAAG
jgi:hypothetical protein